MKSKTETTYGEDDDSMEKRYDDRMNYGTDDESRYDDRKY
jgi:hypothetical protein